MRDWSMFASFARTKQGNHNDRRGAQAASSRVAIGRHLKQTCAGRSPPARRPVAADVTPRLQRRGTDDCTSAWRSTSSVT